MGVYRKAVWLKLVFKRSLCRRRSGSAPADISTGDDGLGYLRWTTWVPQ